MTDAAAYTPPSSAMADHLISTTTTTPLAYRVTMALRQLERREMFRQPEPRAARIFGILFTVITAGICTSLLTKRVSTIRSWRRLPYIRWLVLTQYAGAFIYILIAAVLQYGYDPNVFSQACSGGAIICIVVYGLIKLFYLFLADRLHVVRSATNRRLKSKLFLFHTAGISGGISVMIVVFSILRIDDRQDGQCVIGVSRFIMLAGVCVDLLLNIYLTAFFLYYLSKSFSIRPTRGIRTPVDLIGSGDTEPRVGAEIRALAWRTVIGLAISLAATISNLAASITMNGEVLWLCFLTCKADILIGVIVLYWITAGGRARDEKEEYSSSYKRSHGSRRTPSRTAVDSIPLASPSYEAHLRIQQQQQHRRNTSAASRADTFDFDLGPEESTLVGMDRLSPTGTMTSPVIHPPNVLGRGAKGRMREF